MQKNNGLNNGKFSINATRNEIFGIIRNVNIKVFALVLAFAMGLGAWGIFSEYYAVAYDVYYGDVNVGVTTSKEEAMELYNEAETDVAQYSNKKLKHDLKFVMTITPVTRMLASDIYRGIISAAEGEGECWGIYVNGEAVTKVATKKEAQDVIRCYRESFERENIEIYSDYEIVQEVDIVTEIKDFETALNDIRTSGLVTVCYSEVIEDNVTIYFKEIIEEDPSLPQGVTGVKNEGSTGSGRRVMTYYENGLGKQASTPVFETITEAVDRVIVVGSGESGLKKNSLPWPVTGNYSSAYGARWGRNHNGVDIAAKKGTPIYAPASGVVTFAGDKSGWGYGIFAVIDHGAGYETTYAHMSSVNVSEGDIIHEGDLIGTVGTTGRVTGAHLHFEVKLNGEFENPLSYIEG